MGHITYSELKEPFSGILGLEKSRLIVEEAMKAAGVKRREIFEKDEAMAICNELIKSDESIVRCIALSLKGRLDFR